MHVILHYRITELKNAIIDLTSFAEISRESRLLKTGHIFRGTDSAEGSASLEFRDEELRDGFSLMSAGPLFVSS